MKESFLKLIVHKYYDPSASAIVENQKIKVIETNISFNKSGYYNYDYEKNYNLNDCRYISFDKEFNNTSSLVIKQALSYKDNGSILENFYSKSININKNLLKNEEYMASLRSLCEINNLKYMIMSSSSSLSNIWNENKLIIDKKKHKNMINHSKNEIFPVTSNIQIKILGLQTDLETSYPLFVKLTSQYNNTKIFIKKLDFESFKLLPLLFGYKQGDLLSLSDHYKVDVLYPNFFSNIQSFMTSDYECTNLYILSKNSQADVMIVHDILKEKLEDLKSNKESIIIKSLSNLSNDYINFEEKLKYFHNDMNFLQILNNLMFEHSCFVELNLKLKQILIIGNYEVFILNLLKIIHLKVYNKVYEFNIVFNNDQNYDIFKKTVLSKEPYLFSVFKNEDSTQKSIQLIGDKWEDIIGLYINLNQENMSYSFYIELSNEFKEFIIGKKFGKINKIEKQCNMKCKISILINNEKNQGNKEFITLQLTSDNFLETINCLKLIQLELPYEKKLYIPEAFHKFIIGMNGENIQSIMRRYNCFIQFLNTFNIKQNKYSFIRHSNVIIRCPLKNYNNVHKVIEELQSLSMEIFNLSTIQTNDNYENSNNLTGLQFLKLKQTELDLILFNGGEKKLHNHIGLLEMKYNLFIRFPEFDEDKNEEDELLLILKSCKHNTVLKLEEKEGEMNILKIKSANEKLTGSIEEEDENLELCFNELIQNYIPKKNKHYNSIIVKNNNNLSSELKKMLLWKMSLLVIIDEKDSSKSLVYKL